MSAEKRIRDLQQELLRHNHLYHTLNSPEISDAAYDKLFRELLELEKQRPDLVDPNSPTRRVGSALTGDFPKVKHTTKMLSLENAYTAGELLAFLGRGCEALMEPKIDGLSLSLIYREGRLFKAVTRGDGSEGDDVTRNARTIVTIPLQLEEPLDLEVRGEVYMSLSVFARLNAELEIRDEQPMANARNAAAGALKLKDPQEVARRHLSFVAYGTPQTIPGVETQYDLEEYLAMIGFCTPSLLPASEEVNGVVQPIILEDEKQILGLLARADELRQKLLCATDGLVFKVNSIARQHELDEGTRTPKWAIAFKFPPERKPTKLVNITLQVGKTGKLTPVASFAPVGLSGTTVKSASLCNADEIQRLAVDVGDTVLVEKSAEIIPKVVGIVYREKPWVPGETAGSPPQKPVWSMPANCPFCGSALSRTEGYVDWFCPNQECPEQVVARLIYATSKEALDIDGCGKSTVRLLADNGVRKLSDLFAIPPEKLSFLPTAARKRFLAGREQAKSQPLWRKLLALNIEGLGKTKAQNVGDCWTSWSSAFDEKERLIEMLEPSTYESACRWVTTLANAQEVDRLAELGFELCGEAKPQGPLSGKTFVITGTLVTGGRPQVAALIEQKGGTVKGSVSKKVDYLVVGFDEGATKSGAAQRLGVRCISEAELYDMMGLPMTSQTSKTKTRERIEQ